VTPPPPQPAVRRVPRENSVALRRSPTQSLPRAGLWARAYVGPAAARNATAVRAIGHRRRCSAFCAETTAPPRLQCSNTSRRWGNEVGASCPATRRYGRLTWRRPVTGACRWRRRSRCVAFRSCGRPPWRPSPHSGVWCTRRRPPPYPRCPLRWMHTPWRPRGGPRSSTWRRTTPKPPFGPSPRSASLPRVALPWGTTTPRPPRPCRPWRRAQARPPRQGEAHTGKATPTVMGTGMDMGLVTRHGLARPTAWKRT
jgi:hypothetical protein